VRGGRDHLSVINSCQLIATDRWVWGVHGSVEFELCFASVRAARDAFLRWPPEPGAEGACRPVEYGRPG
jgi:hypothetical protein